MKYIVNEPVIDLRREPIRHSGTYDKDPLQETQLLFGETVLGADNQTQGEWIKIQAREQMKCSNSGQWIPYPGWVLKKQITQVAEFPEYSLIIHHPWVNIHLEPEASSPIFSKLSFGTRLQVVEDQIDWWAVRIEGLGIGWLKKEAARLLSSIHAKTLDDRRLESIQLAKNMLKAPYLWGGRSAYQPDWLNQVTSVDCAGLVNLIYRVCHGIDIPRDSHDQFLKCRKLDFNSLQIGDLVFLASKESPSRVGHVMLFGGGDTLLESTMQTKSVQMTSFKEKLGESLEKIGQGGETEKFIVYHGSIDFSGIF